MVILSGRESLIRLVGKRRRTLPPQLSALLHPDPSPPLHHDPDSDPNPKGGPIPPFSSSFEDGSSSGAGSAAEKNAKEAGDSEWVSCPVCARSIRRDDYSVNSHLDVCLDRGSKRKLTQRTLLEFSFSPRSDDGMCLSGSNAVLNDVTGRTDDKNGSLMQIRHSLNVNRGEGFFTSNLLEHLPPTNGAMGNIKIDNAADWEIVKQPSSETQSLEIKLPNLDVSGDEDSKFVEVLETFIVGHRFHDHVDLKEGASVYTLRDPQNPKDKHAIKVLHADPACERMLGYLPRGLARYLSPLIDKHLVKCKGSVTALPKHPLDVFAIQLSCQKIAACAEVESIECQFYESSWKNITYVTEQAKIYPSSMTKYQKNFQLLVQDVLDHHANLFTDDERLSLGAFNSLSDDGQRLFIRLYTRKGPWFRMSNISYPEILDSQNAVNELQATGYLNSFNPSKDPIKDEIKEVLDVLTVSELREMLTMGLSKKGVSSMRRGDLSDSLYASYQDGSCPLMPTMVSEKAGTCVRISPTAEILFWRVQRLFFLNGEQDLSAFLLVDLGLVKFPKYVCNISRPIFENRSDLLAYEEAIGVAQIMDQSLDANNNEVVMRCIDTSADGIPSQSTKEADFSCSGCPPKFFTCFSASWVYSKVLFLGVSVLESQNRYEDSVGLLKTLLSRITSDSRRGHWTLRLSVDLEHLDRLNESLSVAEAGVVDPWVRAGSRIALQRRVLRLGKPPRRWKPSSFAISIKRKIKEVSIHGRPLNCETGARSLFYGYDGDLCGVEQLALQFYAGDGGGWQGVHSETGIWTTLFGLLMWDVIFADVPNVFRSKFQMAPLDLDTDDFYIARKSLIESHLLKIYEGMGEEILIASWELHMGTACRGVNWERHTLSDLRVAVSCIGGRLLTSVFRNLALDYRNWCSGMPDLLLWRFNDGDKDRGEAKLVEVKGPRDRLSEQQRAWMLLLMDCGFDTEVCKVTPVSKCR